MKIEIDPDDVKTVELDDRGRGYVSPKYKNTTVEIAIMETKDAASEAGE